MPGARWTEEEIELLKHMAAMKYTIDNVAKKLGRSRTSVACFASRACVRFDGSTTPRVLRTDIPNISKGAP